MIKTKKQEPKPVNPDVLVFEVIAGVEGHCLSVADESLSGYRLAGPKPWGGGSVVHRFKVSKKELLAELKNYPRKGNFVFQPYGYDSEPAPLEVTKHVTKKTRAGAKKITKKGKPSSRPYS